MISKVFLLFPFLLILLPLTTASGRIPDPSPIQNVSDPKVHDLGAFAVSQYDKRGESHLYFIEVVNGTIYYPSPAGQFIWYFWLRAKNCSEPGPPAIYFATVYENMLEPQLSAYGSTFTSYGDVYLVST